MAAIDIPTSADQVPIVIPAMTSPTVENTQPMKRFQRRSSMPSEMWPPHHHGDGAASIGDHGEPADRHVAVATQRLDHSRHENQHAQAGGDDADIVQRQQQHLGIVKRLPQREFAHRFRGAAFAAIRVTSQSRSSAVRNFACSGRSVTEERDHSDHDGRDRFGEYMTANPADRTGHPGREARRYRCADRDATGRPTRKPERCGRDDGSETSR